MYNYLYIERRIIWTHQKQKLTDDIVESIIVGQAIEDVQNLTYAGKYRNLTADEISLLEDEAYLIMQNIFDYYEYEDKDVGSVNL